MPPWRLLALLAVAVALGGVCEAKSFAAAAAARLARRNERQRQAEERQRRRLEDAQVAMVSSVVEAEVRELLDGLAKQNSRFVHQPRVDPYGSTVQVAGFLNADGQNVLGEGDVGWPGGGVHVDVRGGQEGR